MLGCVVMSFEEEYLVFMQFCAIHNYFRLLKNENILI